MRILKCAAVAAFIFLVGCAAPVPGGQADGGVDPGPRPTDAQAEEAAMRFLQRALKDPDSIKQFAVTGGPVSTSWFRGLLNGGGYDAGWMVCFEYNAKNSYGGYVGVARERIVVRRYGDRAEIVPWVNWGLVSSSC